MAWMASHLFVNASAPEEVARAVRQLLEAADHRADLGGFDASPAPVAVTPALDGWVAVTGLGPWVDDLTWAGEALSRDLGATVLSCEIFGNCYRVRFSAHAAGEQQQLIRAPDHGWPGAPAEPGTMPLYEDAEQVAFEALRAAGVPAPLVAVGTRPLGTEPEALIELGEGWTLCPGEAGVGEDRLAIALPPLPDDTPPVVPNSASQDFGVMLFEERYVDGRPGADAVDRLLAIEAAVFERARAAYARTGDPERPVSLTMSYHAGSEQDDLDALLRKRGHHTVPARERSRPPWWAFWRHFGKLR